MSNIWVSAYELWFDTDSGDELDKFDNVLTINLRLFRPFCLPSDGLSPRDRDQIHAGSVSGNSVLTWRATCPAHPDWPSHAWSCLLSLSGRSLLGWSAPNDLIILSINQSIILFFGLS